jgi:outer membrane protein OmpA-like peptidoglycan-associated protein
MCLKMIQMIRHGLLMVVLAAIGAAGAVSAQEIRIFAADELPTPAEIAAILDASEEAQDAPAATVTRGIRLVDPGQSEARRAVRINREKSGPRPGKAPGVIAIPLRFTFNSESVASDGLAKLDAVAAGIKRLPLERIVYIEGHTDAHGTPEYNFELSLKRALAVRNYLVKEHGIAAGKLVAVGKGESVPLVKANPFAPENRRVQFRAA